MSNNGRHCLPKRFKVLCAACQERKARFRYRGEVRADRDHTLCFACYRAELNRVRARRMGGQPLLPLERPAVVRPALTARQLAHRQLMLDHLRRRTAVAS
jgi:hypothetical protein